MSKKAADKRRCESWIGPYRCDSTDTKLWFEEGVCRGWFCNFCMTLIQGDYESRKREERRRRGNTAK